MATTGGGRTSWNVSVSLSRQLKFARALTSKAGIGALRHRDVAAFQSRAHRFDAPRATTADGNFACCSTGRIETSSRVKGVAVRAAFEAEKSLAIAVFSPSPMHVEQWTPRSWAEWMWMWTRRKK